MIVDMLRPPADPLDRYEAVAAWLPDDVRETIEATTPCPVTGGGHTWKHARVNLFVDLLVAPVDVREHWACGCGVVVGTDPAALGA